MSPYEIPIPGRHRLRKTLLIVAGVLVWQAVLVTAVLPATVPPPAAVHLFSRWHTDPCGAPDFSTILHYEYELWNPGRVDAHVALAFILDGALDEVLPVVVPSGLEIDGTRNVTLEDCRDFQDARVLVLDVVRA